MSIPATRCSCSVTHPVHGQLSTRNAKIFTIMGAPRDWTIPGTRCVPPRLTGYVPGATCMITCRRLNPRQVSGQVIRMTLTLHGSSIHELQFISKDIVATDRVDGGLALPALTGYFG